MIRKPIQSHGNRYLERVLEGVSPHYDQALSVAAQAQRQLNELQPVPAVPAEIDPMATGELSDEWLDRQLDNYEVQERLKRRRALLVELKQRAEASATAVIEASVDPILTALHRELTTIIAAATQAADQLDGATNAEQAIAADRANAWKDLSQLAGDYEHLRIAQRIIMQRNAFDYMRSAQPSVGGEDTASDLYVANLDQLWPTWKTPGQAGERVINISGQPHRYEPWPPDQPQLLLWLVTSSAQPWIPTTSQLDQLWRRRRDRMNPNPKPIQPRPKNLNRTPASTNHRVVEPVKPIERTEESIDV